MRPSLHPQPRRVEPDRLRVLDPPRLSDAVEPLLSIADVCRILVINRRTFERMRTAGRIPSPDLFVGKRCPRWAPATIRNWIAEGGKP
jgi:hypothetical protein